MQKEPALKTDLQEAIVFYRKSSVEQRRLWMIEWAQTVRPEYLGVADELPDEKLTTDVAYLRMLNRGFKLPIVYVTAVNYWVSTLPKPTRKRRVESEDPNFEMFDEALTALADGRKIVLHFDPKKPIERVRQYCLEQADKTEYTEVQKTWFAGVLDKIEKMSVRTPKNRAEKAQSIERVKWATKDEEFGLESNTSPLKAIGAKVLYIFDPKSRRLMRIGSKTGIRFEGVNITGIDSCQYVTIRKPERTMRNGLSVHDLGEIFRDLKSHDCEFKRSQARFVYLASE